MSNIFKTCTVLQNLQRKGWSKGRGGMSAPPPPVTPGIILGIVGEISEKVAD